MIVHTYMPVGAGARKDKPLFGRVLAALEDDPENPRAALLQTIAEELLARPGQTLAPFVAKSLRRCLDSARAERTAENNDRQSSEAIEQGGSPR